MGRHPDDAWRLLRSRARNWIRRRHGRWLCLREGHWLLQWILRRLHMVSPLRLRWWMRGLNSSQRQAGRGAMPLREGACANTEFPTSLLFKSHTFLKCLKFIVSCTALSLSSSQRNLYFVEFVFVCLCKVFENSFKQMVIYEQRSTVGFVLCLRSTHRWRTPRRCFSHAKRSRGEARPPGSPLQPLADRSPTLSELNLPYQIRVLERKHAFRKLSGPPVWCSTKTPLGPWVRDASHGMLTQSLGSCTWIHSK